MESISGDTLAVEPDGDCHHSLPKSVGDPALSTASFDLEYMQPEDVYPGDVDLNCQSENAMDTSAASEDCTPNKGCEITVCHEDSLSSASIELQSASFAFPDRIEVQVESMFEGEAITQGFSEVRKPRKRGEPDFGSQEEPMQEVEDMKVADGSNSPTTTPECQEKDNFINPFHRIPTEPTDSSSEVQGVCSIGDTDVGSIGQVSYSESLMDASFIYEDSIICEETVSSEQNVKIEGGLLENPETVCKVDMSSDEEVNLYANSGKSEAESSSSKDESPSGPSCSGMSRAGINSLSSDSEDELPSLNFTLQVQKRKRETRVEELSTSSGSEDGDSKSEIDYSNLTPEEIKALIEEAKRYGSKRKCKCPKKKWSELPIMGPTETSSKCTIGKGDWSEKSSVSCEACSAGSCDEATHKHGRRTRRKGPHPRSILAPRPRIMVAPHPRSILAPRPRSILARTRARGTIGQDVPVIDLSDSEETTSMPPVVSEVTITNVPVLPPGEFIVLSSSEEDDEVVCEAVVKTDVKNRTTGVEILDANVSKAGSPDVVVLNASSTQVIQPPQLPAYPSFGVPHTLHSYPPLVAPLAAPLAPQAQDAELWPEVGIDLGNWDETINLLANIVGPSSADAASNNRPPVSASAPERPASPEGWSCPICLEHKTAVIEIMSTTCGHVFCGECIRSAVKIHKKCPTCRKKLTLKQFHKIFL